MIWAKPLQKVFYQRYTSSYLPGLGNAFVSFIESTVDWQSNDYWWLLRYFENNYLPARLRQGKDVWDSGCYGCYLLPLRCLCFFVVQKFVLKQRAHLHFRAKQLELDAITDNSVRIPLTHSCALVALFVIGMYLCVPYGSFVRSWGL